MKLAAVMMAAACGVAFGGIQTQSVSIDMDTTRDEFGTQVSFEQFDTQGGTRVLTGVTARWQGQMSMELTAQSLHPEFLAADTWSAEGSHLAWFSLFSTEGGDGGGGSYLFSLGGVFIDNLTGDLTPGEPGATPFDPGNPGDPVSDSVSASIDSFLEVSPADFDFFTGGATMDGFFGPFTDILLNEPVGGANIQVFASRLTQLGTVSLDYEFTVIPAPAGAGLLAMGGLVAARRRR